MLNRPLVIKHLNISLLRAPDRLLLLLFGSSGFISLLLTRLYILFPRNDPSVPCIVLSLLLLLVRHDLLLLLHHHLFLVLIIVIIVLLLAVILIAINNFIIPSPLQPALSASPFFAVLSAPLFI
ncbi:MAG: hypothetical protein ACMG6E_06300 [Candidatus Roizmanbacteria bacterium]